MALIRSVVFTVIRSNWRWLTAPILLLNETQEIPLSSLTSYDLSKADFVL